MVKNIKKSITLPRLSPRGKRLAAEQAAGFLPALGLATAVLFGSVSPFGCAFVAAVGAGQLPAAVLGGCLGCFLRLRGAAAAQRAAAVIVAGFVNLLLHKAGFVRQTAVTRSINAAACLLLAGLTVMAAQGFSVDGVLLNGCEALLGGAGAYLFCGAIRARQALRDQRAPDGEQRACLLAFGAVLLGAVEWLNAAGLSFARAAAALIVLLGAQVGGLGAAAVIGCALGFTLSVFEPELPPGVVYTCGALAAGLFRGRARLPKAFGFWAAGGVFLLLSGTEPAAVVPLLLENTLGCLSFLLLPGFVLEQAQRLLSRADEMPQAEAMKQLLLMRVGRVKKAMGEVSTAMERITDEIGRYDQTEKQDEKGALVFDQFRHMAGVLEDVSLRLAEDITFDMAAAQRVETVLRSFGVSPKQVVCTRTGGRGRVEIHAEPIRGSVSRAALLGALEKACGFALNSPTVTEQESGTSLVFDEKPALNLRIGHAQHVSDASGLCGDRFERFTDREGRQVVLVSDGMGTGARAAIDGAVAAWLFARLLAAGLNPGSAFRLTNSAMIAKSAEETLATVDAVRFDLYAKKAAFFKAGANVSLVRRGHRVATVGKSSLPLGILRETQIDEATLPIGAGDIVLVMSDGVGAECLAQVKSELAHTRKKDPAELAEQIVKLARESSPAAHCDDITAVVVMIGQN